MSTIIYDDLFRCKLRGNFALLLRYVFFTLKFRYVFFFRKTLGKILLKESMLRTDIQIAKATKIRRSFRISTSNILLAFPRPLLKKFLIFISESLSARSQESSMVFPK